MRFNQQLPKKILLVSMLSVIAFLYWQMRPGLSKAEGSLYTERGMGAGAPDSLFEGVSAHFQSAGRCDHCHGHDPAGIASVSGELGDVNVVDDWSSSMMANAARDPLWRAKVSLEVSLFPELKTEIESTCTKCHTPMGYYDAIMNGEEHFGMADLLADEVALDGVSCLACHQQMPITAPVQHSGLISYNTDGLVYGQYESPLISPMADYTGLNPEHGSHISDSKLCATCHALVTNPIDDDGNPTSYEFVEQATWHEWLNSVYPDQGESCQSCHMPKVDGPDVRLIAGYDTEPRSDFALHSFRGGNKLMLGILRDNRDPLEIYASEAQFNKAIATTVDYLQNESLLLEMTEVNRTQDTLYIDVKLTNIAGHKLPTGNPSRRLNVHFALSDVFGNEIFRSGGFDDEFYTTNEDAIEPHHNVITSEEQVQLYEMVMGDLYGNKTTAFTKAYNALKDNRLAPAGFTASHPQYDTAKVVLGFNDPDFNHDPQEGSGTDIIHYHIPLNGYTGSASASVQVWFETVPRGWLDDLFAVSTPEIDYFKNMYNAADRAPVLMRSQTREVDAFVGIASVGTEPMTDIFQNLSGSWNVKTLSPVVIQCFDSNGKLIVSKEFAPGNHQWKLQVASGVYIFNITDKSGNRKVKKVMSR